MLTEPPPQHASAAKRRLRVIRRTAALALSLVLGGCAGVPAHSGNPSTGIPASGALSPAPNPSPVASDPGPATPVESDVPSSPATRTPFVESNIVDREDVPASLYDKYWIVRGSWASSGQVSHVGTTARIVLPNELVLGADAGIVASYAVINDDQGREDPVIGPNGVTINVRDIRTGAIRRTFDTPVDPAHGLMAGERLFWWGSTLPFEAHDHVHGTIWGIDLTDAASTPREIVPAGELDDVFGGRWSRSPLRLSDRGRAVTSTVVGDDARATQVIDVSSMSLRTTITDEIAFGVVGTRALVRRPDGLIILDLETGRRVGPLLEVFQTLRSSAGDDERFVQYGRGDNSGVYVAAMDLDSGESRILLHQPRGVTTLSLDADLSVPELLVLVDTNALDEGESELRVSLLDAETGELQPDAFAIDVTE